MNGRDIYFDESFKDTISSKMPGCIRGIPEIKVKAKIYLKKKTESISSNPSTTNKIYEAIVIELYDIEVKTEPCED